MWQDVASHNYHRYQMLTLKNMSILPRGAKNRWLECARHCWIKWKVHIYSYYIYIYTVNTCVAPNSSDETRNSILRYASSFDPQTSHANEGPVRTTSWLRVGFSIIGQHSSNIQMNVTQEIQPLNIGNKYIYIYINIINIPTKTCRKGTDIVITCEHFHMLYIIGQLL